MRRADWRDHQLREARPLGLGDLVSLLRLRGHGVHDPLQVLERSRGPHSLLASKLAEVRRDLRADRVDTGALALRFRSHEHSVNEQERAHNA